MGGPGSGRRWRNAATECTDGYRQLDVRRWQRDGLLVPGKRFAWQWTRNGDEVASINVQTEVERVILSYRQRQDGGEWQSREYSVWLDWTACTYGGHRAWFKCPAKGCGRRVAVLYGGAIFACRNCYRLAYRCQRESSDDRATRRADRIRARLGWEPGILNGEGPKPKWMRWRTFDRLTGRHEDFVRESLAGMARRFGMFKRRLW